MRCCSVVFLSVTDFFFSGKCFRKTAILAFWICKDHINRLPHSLAPSAVNQWGGLQKVRGREGQLRAFILPAPTLGVSVCDSLGLSIESKSFPSPGLGNSCPFLLPVLGLMVLT